MDLGNGHGLGDGSARFWAAVTFFVWPFSFFLFSAAQQQTSVLPPPVLAEALKLEPGVRLLNPATDLREYSQPALEKFGYWPPWIVRDLDRDKRPDVAAVVVRLSPKRTEYGVIAVHARSPKEIHWVMPLDVDPTTVRGRWVRHPPGGARLRRQA